MRTPLVEEFNLSNYTYSPTAVRLGISNTPDKKAIDNLLSLHQKVITAILQDKTLTGELYCNSGYRSPELNKSIGGASNSQHMTGQAADLEYYEDGVEMNIKLYDAIIKSGVIFDQLIKEKGTVDKPAWIHISYSTSGNRKQILTIK